MNKRGYVHTYLPFKKYLILVAVIVVLYLGYNFFILKSLGLVKLPRSCPKTIIGDRIQIGKRDTGLYFGNWSDGTSFGGTDCREGSSQGENINYIYCGKSFDLGYRKTPINPDGTIGKEIKFRVIFAYDPNDKTEEGYKVVYHSCSS